MSKTLCSFPFVHTDIEPNGDIKFCCAAMDGLHKDPDGKIYNVTTHSLKEAWNSELLKQTRLDLIQGKRPEVCSYCWMTENEDNTHGASVRLQAANRRIPVETIQDRIDYAEQHNGELSEEHLAFDFQLSIGNLCNLSCKMCNPTFSTGYQKFYNKIYNINNPVVAFDWPVTQSLAEIFKDHSDSLERIFFTGGEPTLIPEVLDFIDYLSQRPDIVIWPSTNCTNINKRLLDSLEQFNEVWLNLSLDGMGDIAYLQRTPSHWPSIEKNVDMLLSWVESQRAAGKSVHLTIITTLTAINLHHALEFWRYFADRYSNQTNFGLSVNVVKGSKFSIDSVPQEIADKISQELMIYKQNPPKNLEYSIEYMENLLANTKFAENYDQIHQYLDELQHCHPDKNIRQIYSIYYK